MYTMPSYTTPELFVLYGNSVPAYPTLQNKVASDDLYTQVGKWKDSLTALQRAVVADWTGTGFKSINKVVGAEWFAAEAYNTFCAERFYVREEDKQYPYDSDAITEFCLALSTCPKYSGMVYRGSNAHRDFPNIGESKEYERFTSWSINPKAALGFAYNQVLYAIEVEAAYVDPVSHHGRNRKLSSEEEVILPPGKLTVIAVYTAIDNTGRQTRNSTVTIVRGKWEAY